MKRKGQFARMQRRQQASAARQRRMERTALMRQYDFDKTEIAAHVGVSESTVRKYCRELDEMDVKDSVQEQEKFVSKIVDVYGMDRKKAVSFFVGAFMQDVGYDLQQYWEEVEQRIDEGRTDYEQIHQEAVEEAKSQCFIATAAYGTATHQHLDVLRDFRDRTLQNNFLGRIAVKTYYTVSPPIADLIRRSPRLSAAIRATLSPIIRMLEKRGYEQQS